ncbi:hypothetical protein TSAR_005761 [Trichomalopsis sarcophagae]|uniref:Uncharacterized protein n=1 Tax=Trichomalopsis sarcophagae TaxID=543379 RepID=A0A232EDH9_9HYME|nr:hypothetical protein TSAR_005761 [Trichomalopsis sarcophagae]
MLKNKQSVAIILLRAISVYMRKIFTTLSTSMKKFMDQKVLKNEKFGTAHTYHNQNALFTAVTKDQARIKDAEKQAECNTKEARKLRRLLRISTVDDGAYYKQ